MHYDVSLCLQKSFSDSKVDNYTIGVIASSPETYTNQLPIVPQLQNVARPLPLRVAAMFKVLVCISSLADLYFFLVLAHD